MDRRAFLAAGVTLLAGCGQGGDPPTSPSPSPTTVSSSPTATPTATPTQTATPTESDTPTETVTSAPDPRDRLLDEAAGYLSESVDAYAENGRPQGHLTGVTADVSVSKSDVRSPLHEARDAFSELGEMDLSGARDERLSRLRGAHWFLWWLPSTHDAVRRTYRTATDVWSDVQDRDWFSAKNSAKSIRERSSDAAAELAKIDEDSDPGDADSFDRLSPGDYEAKLDQFDAELSGARSLGEALEAMVAGFEQYESGQTGYEDADYDGAATDYFDAHRSFEDGVERLSDTEWAGVYGDVVEQALCVGEAMAAGCDLLDRAARAGEEEQTERMQSLEQDAMDAFAECDALAEQFGIGE